MPNTEEVLRQLAETIRAAKVAPDMKEVLRHLAEEIQAAKQSAGDLPRHR